MDNFVLKNSLRYIWSRVLTSRYYRVLPDTTRYCSALPDTTRYYRPGNPRAISGISAISSYL
eukprot:1333635-Amorphochlora_amoeboformis.AAC.1